MDNAKKNEVESLGKALVFEAGKAMWACELSRVKEIVRSERITGLPNAIKAVAGVINVRGEVLPVLNFWEEPGNQSGNPSSDEKETVVIFHSDEGNIGLRVRQVSSIEDIHAFDLGSDGEAGAEKEIVSCNVYLSESGSLPMVDVKLVMESIKVQGGGWVYKQDVDNDVLRQEESNDRPDS